jgi:DNA-binding response OmpR family regulator
MAERKKILVIDDDEDICYLVKNLLQDEFEVKAAMNGKQGLKELENNNYDLVLLDIMMPDMDGYEVMEIIKEKTQDIPIIFLSAKDSTSDLILGFKKGAARYITKPIDTHELIHEIKTTLRIK